MEKDTPEQEAHNRRARIHQENLKQAMKEVIATHAGRLLLWHILEGVCQVFSTTETGEERSSLVRAGERRAGLILQRQMQDWAPAEFVHLLTENMARSLEHLSKTREEP